MLVPFDVSPMLCRASLSPSGRGEKDGLQLHVPLHEGTYSKPVDNQNGGSSTRACILAGLISVLCINGMIGKGLTAQ